MVCLSKRFFRGRPEQSPRRTLVYSGYAGGKRRVNIPW